VKKLVSAAMLLVGMLSTSAMAVEFTGNDFDGTYCEVGYADKKLVPGVSRKFDIFSN
jgi:hypothetical protein